MTRIIYSIAALTIGGSSASDHATIDDAVAEVRRLLAANYVVSVAPHAVDVVAAEPIEIVEPTEEECRNYFRRPVDV